MSKDYSSPKTWLGSEDENVLKLLSELMETVAELATICASHTHSTSPAPNEAGDGECSSRAKGQARPNHQVSHRQPSIYSIPAQLPPGT
ncbi:hypothetical protein ACFFLG_14850 [Shewanella indica]|uniref:hypothetical protein n=1 Tax=Shewanella indica TaxID=768528 RepID=UPI0016732EFB|nr:hypothetical protein [Shewanella indica]